MKTHDIFTTRREPVMLDAGRQLFCDDHVIEDMAGLTRVMHTPERLGPVLEPDPSIGEITVQTRTAPQWNSEKALWEWWYWGSHRCEPYGPYQATSVALTKYATSRDGLVWETPDLRMFKLEGSEAKNILSFAGCAGGSVHDAGHRALYHCLRDERDPDPGRRYKGLLGVHERIPAVSPDGFVWRPIEATTLQSSDESSMVYDPTTDQFLAVVKRGTVWGRSMALMTSRDFEKWEDHGIIIHADGIDWAGRMARIRRVAEDEAYVAPPLIDDADYISETYNMAVHPTSGGYVGLVNIFDPAGAIPPPHMNHTGLNQVQLAFSRNLRNWRRIGERQGFLAVQPWDGENYDTQQILPAGSPVDMPDRIRIYYVAARFRGHKALYPQKYHPWFERGSALCAADLRPDGYLSVDANERGSLLTRVVRSTGDPLRVNVDVRNGRLLAEVLDAETLAVLAGYDADSCHALVGDHMAGRLLWGARSLAELRDRPVRIRFSLAHGAFYSFWVQR